MTKASLTKNNGEVLSQERLWFGQDVIKALSESLGVKITKKNFEIVMVQEKPVSRNGSTPDQDGRCAVRYVGDEAAEDLQRNLRTPMPEFTIDARRVEYATSGGTRVAHEGWATKVEPIVAEGDNIPTPTVFIPQSL